MNLDHRRQEEMLLIYALPLLHQTNKAPVKVLQISALVFKVLLNSPLYFGNPPLLLMFSKILFKFN